jgi:hypothetical protein
VKKLKNNRVAQHEPHDENIGSRHKMMYVWYHRCLPLSEHLTVYYLDSIVGYYNISRELWYYEYHWMNLYLLPLF